MEQIEPFRPTKTTVRSNITADVSDKTNKFNENINKYQKTSKEIIEKSIDTTSNYQQQAINTFQSITNTFVELQKSLLETYQSSISRFLDVTSRSYRNDSTSPQQIYRYLQQDQPNYYRQYSYCYKQNK